MALPVKDTISKPFVADSFQFQLTYFSVFVLTLSSAPKTKPSEANAVTVSASVASALFESEAKIFVTPRTASVMTLLSEASLFLFISSCARSICAR